MIFRLAESGKRFCASCFRKLWKTEDFCVSVYGKHAGKPLFFLYLMAEIRQKGTSILSVFGNYGCTTRLRRAQVKTCFVSVWLEKASGAFFLYVDGCARIA